MHPPGLVIREQPRPQSPLRGHFHRVVLQPPPGQVRIVRLHLDGVARQLVLLGVVPVQEEGVPPAVCVHIIRGVSRARIRPDLQGNAQEGHGREVAEGRKVKHRRPGFAGVVALDEIPVEVVVEVCGHRHGDGNDGAAPVREMQGHIDRGRAGKDGEHQPLAGVKFPVDRVGKGTGCGEGARRVVTPVVHEGDGVLRRAARLRHEGFRHLHRREPGAEIRECGREVCGADVVYPRGHGGSIGAGVSPAGEYDRAGAAALVDGVIHIGGGRGEGHDSVFPNGSKSHNTESCFLEIENRRESLLKKPRAPHGGRGKLF